MKMGGDSTAIYLLAGLVFALVASIVFMMPKFTSWTGESKVYDDEYVDDGFEPIAEAEPAPFFAQDPHL